MKVSRVFPWIFLLLGASVAGGQGTREHARAGSSLDSPTERPRDLTGRSVKTPRVRAVHSTDPEKAGTTAYLLERDPWLAFQRGRELMLREFSRRDGVFGNSGELDGPRLQDGVSHMAARDHASSCAMCHNVPWRDMGAGANISKNGGRGRNTPHLFGAGLLEMIGWQNRLQLLRIADKDASGWISLEEAKGREAVIRTAPGADGSTTVALGRFDDTDGDGHPDLDQVVSVWYVDAKGQRIPWALSLEAPGVAGYSFEYQVFGFGSHPRQSPRSPPTPSTLRAFTAQAFDIHAGLQSCDPVLGTDEDADGLSGTSISGAVQFVSAVPRDRGAVRDERGVSLDDPDRDGIPEEISCGDLDLAEFYLLNHPRPAERSGGTAAKRGRERFAEIGCAGCHTPDWAIEAASAGSVPEAHRSPGDRRSFDLQVAEDPATGELVGRLIDLTRAAGNGRVPARGAFSVSGLYSDLRNHDLGPKLHEIQFDGSVIRRHRTPPLWGVASTAPYGHDGGSLDLDAIIRRHGGEAEEVAARYRGLDAAARQEVLQFLGTLVLYSTEDIPADIDGDGKVARGFMVAGQDTGTERLNPEWLFRVPGRIEGATRAPDGSSIRSDALTNFDASYGLDLEWLRDRDLDGFPDMIDREPDSAFTRR